MVKNPPTNAEDTRDSALIPRLGRSPGEGSGHNSSIPAWKILWTEEPGGLQSMGSQSCTQLSNSAQRAEESLESGDQKGVHNMPVVWKEEMKSGKMPKQRKGNPNLGMIPTEYVQKEASFFLFGCTGSSLAHGFPWL